MYTVEYKASDVACVRECASLNITKLDAIAKSNNETIEKVCESFEACIKEERNVRREEIKELRGMFSLGTCTKQNCDQRRPVHD
jgi:hypothetical protein